MFFKKVYRFFRRNKNQFLTDVVVFSFPKSGRTWLRVILAKYFSLYYDAEFRLNLYTLKNTQVKNFLTFFLTMLFLLRMVLLTKSFCVSVPGRKVFFW